MANPPSDALEVAGLSSARRQTADKAKDRTRAKWMRAEKPPSSRRCVGRNKLIIGRFHWDKMQSERRRIQSKKQPRDPSDPLLRIWRREATVCITKLKV